MPVQGALVLGLELALLTVKGVDLMVDGNVIHHLPSYHKCVPTMRTFECGVHLGDVPLYSEVTDVLVVTLFTLL